MIQPNELKLDLPKQVGNDQFSTTKKVWEILLASHNGDIAKVRELAAGCPGLIYAQYNYAPPIHLAVNEGHSELVRYLLDEGAHDPDYRFYPFQESLQTVANDRGDTEIEDILNQYAAAPERVKFTGDSGHIEWGRTPLQKEFERAVDQNDLARTEEILRDHPDFAKDETYFWGEGILMKPAKMNNREMIDLLTSYGARVPDVIKWVQAYYFERLDGATYMMEKGMNPNTMSWQRVTVLHTMAYWGDLAKVELLLKYGADINPVDDQYRSTPLALAARWGNREMVELLLTRGADPNKSGAKWSTPLAWARKKGHAEIEEMLKKAGAR